MYHHLQALILSRRISMTIYQSEKALPYVYMGIHKETGQFYIGSRTTKKLKLPPEQDLIKYRTSSKYVKPIFDQFDWYIIAMFFDREDCYNFEQELIYENWNNPLKMNKSYFNKNKSTLITTGNKIGDNWIIIFPDNSISIINNLNLFCAKYLLESSCMIRVSQGKLTNYKGWRCIKCNKNGEAYDKQLYTKLLNVNNKWIFVNPLGEYFIVKNFNEFCNENKLNHSCMYAVARKELYHHKKWRCSLYIKSNHNDLKPYQKQINAKNMFKFRHINGNCFITSSLSEFVKYNKISFRIVQKLISGDKSIFNGWVYCDKNDTDEQITKKLKTPEGHHYVIYSPNDITYYSTNLRKFCRDNNLSQSAMSAVSTNKYNNYKGWKCVKLK